MSVHSTLSPSNLFRLFVTLSFSRKLWTMGELKLVRSVSRVWWMKKKASGKIKERAGGTNTTERRRATCPQDDERYWLVGLDGWRANVGRKEGMCRRPRQFLNGTLLGVIDSYVRVICRFDGIPYVCHAHKVYAHVLCVHTTASVWTSLNYIRYTYDISAPSWPCINVPEIARSSCRHTRELHSDNCSRVFFYKVVCMTLLACLELIAFI